MKDYVIEYKKSNGERCSYRAKGMRNEMYALASFEYYLKKKKIRGAKRQAIRVVEHRVGRVVCNSPAPVVGRLNY